jgi:hypothetical protein
MIKIEEPDKTIMNLHFLGENMPEQRSQPQPGAKWKTAAMRLLLIAATVAAAALAGGCPMRHFFGVSCPGCGMTRACLALLQMDFRAAAAYHPLVFALIPGLLYFVFREVLPFPLGRKVETDFSSSVLYKIISFLKGLLT